MSAPLTRTQRLVAGIALLMVCASFTGARSGRGSPAADDEHRWHKAPVDGTAVLGPSTATPLSPLLPPAQAASQFNQHEQETAMSKSYSLPTEPEGVIPSLIERFNSGKVSAMETLYEGAVLIADDGRTVTDRAEISAELERDLSLGLPLEAKARHVFVNGDIAQIVVDWSIDGTGPDGKHVHVEGTASDVARRGADGRWRYLIDNRLGTAVRQPA
jgi:ketosteroid isomerase-like protein